MDEPSKTLPAIVAQRDHEIKISRDVIMESKSEQDSGLVQEGDAVLLRCDKLYKPAVVEKGKYVEWCALFRILTAWHVIAFSITQSCQLIVITNRETMYGPIE